LTKKSSTVANSITRIIAKNILVSPDSLNVRYKTVKRAIRKPLLLLANIKVNRE
jgi:hypothetical protein